MAKNAKSIVAAAAAFTVSFNALNGAIDLYAKQVVAERAGWAESDVIMPPFSKYVWIES